MPTSTKRLSLLEGMGIDQVRREGVKRRGRCGAMCGFSTAGCVTQVTCAADLVLSASWLHKVLFLWQNAQKEALGWTHVVHVCPTETPDIPNATFRPLLIA